MHVGGQGRRHGGGITVQQWLYVAHQLPVRSRLESGVGYSPQRRRSPQLRSSVGCWNCLSVTVPGYSMEGHRVRWMGCSEKWDRADFQQLSCETLPAQAVPGEAQEESFAEGWGRI